MMRVTPTRNSVVWVLYPHHTSLFQGVATQLNQLLSAIFSATKGETLRLFHKSGKSCLVETYDQVISGS